MLKHATILRTSRGQQGLQLQAQWQHQEDSLESGDINSEHHQDSLVEKFAGLLATSSQRSPFDSRRPEQQHERQADLSNNNNNNIISHHSQQQTPSPQPVVSQSCSPSPSLLSTPSKSHLFSRTLSASSPSAPIKGDRQGSNVSASRIAKYDSIIKVFAQSLSQEVEYVSLHVNSQTKSNHIVRSLLRKFRLKHKDPNLYYLTLERWIRKDGLKFRSVMLLGDEACPLQLQQCCSNPPHNDIKFTLQMRTGALVKIFCSDVVPDARYKCLSLSTQTTVEETIELMLHCLNLANRAKNQSGAHDANGNDSAARLRLTGSPGASSSSSSSSTTSSSSGIESEPNCNYNHMSNKSSQHSTEASSQGVGDRLGLESRTSSVTSISSTSNLSNLSASVTDQFCMVIECKDSSYKRVLEPDEYLVDVYQSLLAEAKGQSKAADADTSDGLVNGNGSLMGGQSNQNNCNSTGETTIKRKSHQQQLDQWFFIKLKRRDDYNRQLRSQPTIKFTSPLHNVPLPPIPLSPTHFDNTSNLHNFVSIAHVEVGCRPNMGSSNPMAPSPAPSSALQTSATPSDSPICFQQQQHQQPRHLPQSSVGSKSSQAAPNYPSESARAPPPPAFILLGPPVRPRRRNLSTVSSTFGRPMTINNRRHYDPAQLAEDLDKLDTLRVPLVVPEMSSPSCAPNQQAALPPQKPPQPTRRLHIDNGRRIESYQASSPISS